MPATMIREIERSRGKRFQVYGRKAGRKFYVGTYETKREASEAEEDHRSTQRKIKRGEIHEQDDSRRILREAVDSWLTMLGKSGSRSESNYRQFMNDQILPWIGGLRVSRINSKTVANWRDECLGKYAATTVNSAMGCLASAFNYFMEQGWAGAQPCRGVKLAKVDDRAYNWIRTVPEIERLLRVCLGDVREIVAVAIGTGMRIDEVLHVQWDDVDLERRLITVQRGRKGLPKGGIRFVPILDTVLELLRARALQRGGAALVFPSRTGRVRSKGHVTKSYKGALKAAGLDTSLRFHDLRHTFASMWVMNGGDIFRLSKALGHKSVLVTQRTYAHLAPEAWTQDYGRVSFALPSEACRVYRFPKRVDKR